MARDETLKAMTCSLRAGQVMLESAVSVADVEEAMLRMIRAFGLTRCEVSITLNTITMCNLPVQSGEPITMVKVVDIGEPRLDRLAAVEGLTRAIELGDIGLEGAYEQLQDIEERPVPYRRAITFAATLVSVAAWVVFAGGGPMAALAGAAGAVVIEPLVRQVTRSRVPVVFGSFVAAMVVVLVPNLFLAAGASIAVSSAIVGGLYPLLPGGALVSSVVDGLGGAPLSSLAKGLQTAIVALVLGIGVAAAQGIVDWIEITGETTEVTVAFPVEMAAAGIAVGALAVARGMPVGALVPTVAIAVAAWVTPYLAPAEGVGQIAAVFGAAVVLGLGGQLFARIQRMPGSLYTTSAVYVLVPGTAIYLAMRYFALGSLDDGSQWLFVALRIAGAIAAGVALGVAVGRSVPTPRPRVAMWRRNWFDRPRGAPPRG